MTTFYAVALKPALRDWGPTLWLTRHCLAAYIYAFNADLEDPKLRHRLISAAHAFSV